jgi:type IV fimbrial biogenesis protein FimT
MTLSTCKRHIRDRGFTLLELMFTVALAAIMLGVAIPSFREMSANNKLLTQSNDLVSAINYARSEAITRNSNITLCRATSDSAVSCATSLAPWTNWIVRTPGGVVVRRGTINTYAGSISLSSNFTLDAVTFGADGMARTGGTLVSDREITVCSTIVNTDNIRRVVLGAGSRLSTRKDSGAC